MTTAAATMRRIAGRYVSPLLPSSFASYRPLSSSSGASKPPPPPPPPRSSPKDTVKTSAHDVAENTAPAERQQQLEPAPQPSGHQSPSPQNYTNSTQPQLPPTLKRLTSLYNESSGVTELSSLKAAVTDASRSFDRAVRTASDLRRAVDLKAAAHDDANRRHASMLMKRDQWDAEDAARFADVTSSEVQARRDLADAREALRRAEDEAGLRQVEYMDTMRRRYHEEQIWQEKWRVLSTYWTWGLIGINSLIFVGGQVFHYRRESSRLKRIEELIGEKIPPAKAPSTQRQEEEATAVVDAAEEDSSEAPEELMSESGGGSGDAGTAMTVHGDESVAKNKQEIEKVINGQVADQVDLSPENERSWLEKARNIIRMRQIMVQEGLERRKDNDEVKRNTNSPNYWSCRKSNVAKVFQDAELHWPSAAIGACAGAMAFLAISCFLGGQK